MATRCNIGKVNEDGSITGIYCHYDGYPKYAGNILLNYYKNSDIVNELLNLGDLSSIAENINFVGYHTFAQPEEGVCVAYGRDRGEKNINSKRFISEIEYKMNGKGVDYQYLYKNDKWYYRNVNKHRSDFVELTSEACQ